ncbi:MAG: YicC family protein, partial [SAR324 cluster bacterium]|nr:YicC family protein [SAR324 cluster bacterium]
MTGFGQAKQSHNNYIYEVELRSVNHRYLELSLRLPRGMTSMEFDLRAVIASRLRRGKIDLSIVRKPLNLTAEEATFDKKLFLSYLEIYKKNLEEQGCSVDTKKTDLVFEVLKKPELFHAPEETEDIETEKQTILPLVETALGLLLDMRENEGAALARDIRKRLETLEELQCKIAKASQNLPEKFKERIQSRIKKLESEITMDESRLATELVFYCERADITEELVRLSSHLSQFKESLETEGQGRKLDFIAQECQREFNTIASKAQDATIQ